MIGERYAVAPRHARPSATNRPSLARTWTNVSDNVNPWRLYHALGESPLVQIILAMSLLAIACLLYLTQASQVSVIQYNIADLQAQNAQLNTQNTELRAQAMGLQSIERIQHLATTQLHMVTPHIGSTVWLTVTFPRISQPRPSYVNTVAAERQSQPLSWLRSFFHALKSSL